MTHETTKWDRKTKGEEKKTKKREKRGEEK